MRLEIITEKNNAEFIFTQGSLTGDSNRKNYTPDQFELSWKEWLKFVVLYDDSEIVGFGAIRDFGDYARIFDRYFVFPEFRQLGLGNNEFCKIFANFMIENVEGKIPFISMEHARRRGVLQNAVEACNSVLEKSNHLKMLGGLFETVPGSWQNIAININHDHFDLN